MLKNSFIPDLSKIHTLAFDFDGVFTDNKVWVSGDGAELVRCDRADGLGFDFLRFYINKNTLPLDVFVLSKETNMVVSSRCKKLKINCHHAVGDKASFMDDYFRVNRPDDDCPYKGLIYVGNDLNDLVLMRFAGFSVAPSDAHHMVIKNADLVMPQKGGDGFVRALIEKLLKFNEMSEGDLDEFICHS